MKRFIPVLIVLLLIVALIFVNKGISKTAHPDDDDDDSSSQSSSSAKPATPAPTPASAPGAATGDSLQSEQTVGNPATAKYKITVGWIYDEAMQPNPQALIAALQAVRDDAEHSNGAVSAEIVDLDVPASDLSPAAASVTDLGVMVNGKPIGLPINPGEGMLTAPFLSHTLPSH